MKKKSTSQLRHELASTRKHSVSAPARRSLGEGGFFNLRVLIGVFIVLAGAFLTLLGLGVFSAITASSAQAQQKHKIIGPIDVAGLPPGFDCSTIHEKGIDKMENFRAGAIMIACGEAQGGSAPGNGTSGNSIASRLINSLLLGPLIGPLLFLMLMRLVIGRELEKAEQPLPVVVVGAERA